MTFSLFKVVRFGRAAWTALLLAVFASCARAQPAPETVPPLAGNVAPAPDDAPPNDAPPRPPDDAQGEPPNAPPPPDNGGPPPFDAPGGLGPRNGNGNGYTPPDRRSRRGQMEARLRALMGEMGFPDVEVQNAIIAHIAGEERALAPVRQAARTLFIALRDMNAPPVRVLRALAALRTVLEAERLRRKEAQIVLDDKIGYSKQPRLEALLTILGVLGDGPAFVSPRVPPDAPPRPPKRAPGQTPNAPDAPDASQNSTPEAAPDGPLNGQTFAAPNTLAPPR